MLGYLDIHVDSGICPQTRAQAVAVPPLPFNAPFHLNTDITFIYQVTRYDI
jgi:hypothetical protein